MGAIKMKTTFKCIAVAFLTFISYEITQHILDIRAAEALTDAAAKRLAKETEEFLWMETEAK
jgi:hypothetical protein